jgi:hypothetical protein
MNCVLYEISFCTLHIQVERSYQEEFIHVRNRRFVGNPDVLEKLEHYVKGTECRPLVVMGVNGNHLFWFEKVCFVVTNGLFSAGSGKSALLAHFAQEMSHKRGILPKLHSILIFFSIFGVDIFVLSHFIGASPESTSIF